MKRYTKKALAQMTLKELEAILIDRKSACYAYSRESAVEEILKAQRANDWL